MSTNQAFLTEPSEEEMHALLYGDFATFAATMFEEVYPGRPLIWGEYLGPLMSHLDDVGNGLCKRLIVNMPPRLLKSYSVSVALPAWLLARDPSKEVMTISYSMELAKTFARQTQTVMDSALFRQAFGDVLVPGRRPLMELRTAENGVRRATSIDGTATGFGADYLLFDDPQKPGETLSDAIRRATNDKYQSTFYSRGNDPESKCIVIVMQRLHEHDFVGHVLGLGEEWTVLNLPAIAEEDQQIPYRNFYGPQVFRRKAGASLHPQRISVSTWEKTRRSVGEAVWAAQYQQTPSPPGGGVVKTDWLKRYGVEEVPEFERIVQSWDTANTESASSDYSACTTWGVSGERAYLLDVHRQRANFPDLVRAAKAQAYEHQADIIYIEDHGSGTQLLQQLRSEGLGRFRGVRQTRDKRSRMEGQTAHMENGRIFVPSEASWLPEYLHELRMFPNGRFDDQVDSTSQALAKIYNTGSFANAQAFMDYDDELRRPRPTETWVMDGPQSMGGVQDKQGQFHYRNADGRFYVPPEVGIALLGVHGFTLIQKLPATA